MFAHLRPIFITFLSLMLGVFLAELFRQGKTAYLIVVCAILCLLIFLALFKFAFKNNFFQFFGRYLKFFVIVLLSIAVGALLFLGVFSKVQNENKIKVNESSTYFVVATASSTPSQQGEKVSLFVKDMTLSGSNGEFYKIDNFGMYVKVSSTDFQEEAEELFNAKIGDTVMFYANVKNTNVFDDDKVFAFAYKNGIRYFAYVNYGAVSVVEGTMSGMDSVREYIKTTIYASMNEEQAALAYAVFVGDRSGLDEELQQNFRLTGLSHMLAVSGLHVSIMMLCLMWIFQKCRLKPKISFLLVIVILLFYCILCNFTASVLRASLMTVFLLFGKAFGKQTDSLNSVSLAGIILLLFNPMFVFDLSFLLSFASVFGIILLYSPIYDGLMKLKLGKFVSASLAISISAQIATLPFLINSFGYFSIVSLLANFLIGPIFEYTYIAFFITLLLNLAMPFLWFLQWVVQWGFWLVDAISSWIASWPTTILNVPNLSTLFIFLMFVVLFSLSRFNVSGAKVKAITISGLTLFLVLALIFNAPLHAIF